MLMLSLLLNTALAAPIADFDGVEPPDAELLDLPGFFIPVPDELAPSEPDPYRIWNGTGVSAEEHPAVVALAQRYGGSLFVFCSGSLITPDWVLTAAHCIDSPVDTVVIFGGDLMENEITDMIDADQIIPHPDYNSAQFRNDIGLVRLSERKLDVAPVVLNDEPITDDDHGRMLTIMGFGITEDEGGGSGVKRITQAPIVDHDSQYIVSYDPDTNVCQGDSGGPDFEVTYGDQLEQVGVNSYVTPGCVGGAAGLTRVDKWIPWIQSYAADVLLEPTEFSGSPDHPEPPKVLGSKAVDRDLGEVPRPESYPVGVGCDSVSASGAGVAGGWLALGALLALRRRRGRGRGA